MIYSLISVFDLKFLVYEKTILWCIAFTFSLNLIEIFKFLAVFRLFDNRNYTEGVFSDLLKD